MKKIVVFGGETDNYTVTDYLKYLIIKYETDIVKFDKNKLRIEYIDDKIYCFEEGME